MAHEHEHDREHTHEHEEPLTFEEQIDAQAELEQLIEEKGDFQAAVDAQRRGERPKHPPKGSLQS